MTTAERSHVARSAGRPLKPEEGRRLPDVADREEWDAIPQNQRRHAALQPEDAADRTFGCRASNPDACGKHGMRLVCAFAREDGSCLAPPRSWAKQYSKLLAAKGGG